MPPTQSTYNGFGYVGKPSCFLSYTAYCSLPTTNQNNINTNSNNINTHTFYVDSGSNRFLVINLKLLSNTKILNPPLEINLFKRKVIIHATHVGDVVIRTNLNHQIVLKDVYYTPEGRCNILSISLLQYASIYFKVEYFTAYLYTYEGNCEKKLATGRSVNTLLYTFEFEVTSNQHPSIFAAIEEAEITKTELLHQKLCHL